MPAPVLANGALSALEAAIFARQGRRRGAEVVFLAPCHADRHPSARWNPDKGTWFCDPCEAGGGALDLMARLGIADEHPSPAAVRGIAATYDYRDERGRLLYQVVRYAPKEFRQRRPDGVGRWVWSLEGVRRVLYRLPELLGADPFATVYVVEGEKDADRLAALGLVATSNVGGAGKWRDEYSAVLAGRDVVVIPDNDEPGRRHAEQIVASIQRAETAAPLLKAA